jgi:choline monooxygenase
VRPLDELLRDYDAGAPLEEASTIPGSWYTDPRVAELERRTVFSRSWQPVARAAQLARPGDFVTAEVAGEPVLVVRGHDDVIRGFFNVCRHHAAAVMTEPCGHAERLVCPYHGWTYALDGRLRSTPELDGTRGFDPAANGLAPLAVAVWHHHVFVHLDPDPPPLRGFAAGMAEQLDTLALDTLRFAGRREWEIACNW